MAIKRMVKNVLVPYVKNIPGILLYILVTLGILILLAYFHFIEFTLKSVSVDALLISIVEYGGHSTLNFFLKNEVRDRSQYYLRKLTSGYITVSRMKLQLRYDLKEKRVINDVEGVFPSHYKEIKEVFERQKFKDIKIEHNFNQEIGEKVVITAKRNDSTASCTIVIDGVEKRKKLVENLVIYFQIENVKYKEIRDVVDAMWDVVFGSEKNLFLVLNENGIPLKAPEGISLNISIKRRPLALQYFQKIGVNTISSSISRDNITHNIIINYNANEGTLTIEGPSTDIGKIAQEVSLWYL